MLPDAVALVSVCDVQASVIQANPVEVVCMCISGPFSMPMPEGAVLSFLSIHHRVGINRVDVMLCVAVFTAPKICIFLLLLTCTPSLIMLFDTGLC